MNTTGLNLLIPDKADAEREALAAAFAQGGGSVHRLGRFWDPPVLPSESVRVYGPDTFCLVLQQKLGFPLCSPDDDLLRQVRPEFLRRKLGRHTLGEVLADAFPVFVKPTMPKQFRGAVYRSAEELGEECRGLLPDTAVFTAEVVGFAAEARSFVLEGRVLDAAVYEGAGELAGAVAFVAALIPTVELPRAVVIDVGFIVGRGWAVIEFNAAWGAGLNGCDPAKVLPAVLAASAFMSN